MKSRGLAIVTLCLLPLWWLWPCVAMGREFVSYDLAQFPPASLALSPEQLAAARDGANFDVTEVPVWFLPELELARDELRQGRLPTWNPHARGGSVLHAHGLIGLWYPPNWLALFADDPGHRLAFVAWINLALGGLLTFGLLRQLGLGVLAAWFGAMLFELSGPMATNALFWMRLASYVWLPGVLWGVLAVAQADRWCGRRLAGLAGAVAMAWCGGFPPFATTSTLLGVAFAAWLTVERLRAAGFVAARPQLLRLGLGFLLGAMLALPQVLPSLRFFPLSARPVQASTADVAGQAFESYGLLGFLLPDAISHPSASSDLPYAQTPLALLGITRRLANGDPALPNYNYTEYAVFVGQLGLLLALLGALGGRGGRRGFASTAWLVCAGIALYLPGFDLLLRLPVVGNVWPMRWLAPATLFVAWLAALGVQRLAAAGRRPPLVMAAIAGLLALTVVALCGRPAAWHAADPTWPVQWLADKYHTDLNGVVNHVQAGARPGFDRFAASFVRLAAQGHAAAWWLAGIAVWFVALALLAEARHRRAALLVAGALVMVQLGRHGATVTRGADGTIDAKATPVHTFLRERAAAAAADGGFTIVRGSVEPGLPAQLPPGELMVPGVRDLHFYTHFDGRSLLPLRALLGGWGDRIAAKGYLTMSLPQTLPASPPQHLFEHPLFDLYGVRFVLASEALDHAGRRVGPEPRGPGGEFFVYERDTALPRAFTVPRLVALADDAAIVAALIAPDLQPRAAALVRADELPAAAPAAPDSAARPVRFVRNEPTHLELEVGAGAAPWLVLTDTWLPGWRATVDGAPVDVVRANLSQRTVPLPTTACRVTFDYHSPGLAGGFAAAAAAALALAVLAFCTARARRGT